MIKRWQGIVVLIPSMTYSPRALHIRVIALSRVCPTQISFATMES